MALFVPNPQSDGDTLQELMTTAHGAVILTGYGCQTVKCLTCRLNASSLRRNPDGSVRRVNKWVGKNLQKPQIKKRSENANNTVVVCTRFREYIE